MIDQAQFEAEIRSTFRYVSNIEHTITMWSHRARVFLLRYGDENPYSVEVIVEDNEGQLLWSVIDGRWWTGDTLREAVENLLTAKKAARIETNTAIASLAVTPLLNMQGLIAEIRQVLPHPQIRIVEDDDDPDDLSVRVHIPDREGEEGEYEELYVYYSNREWLVNEEGGHSFKEAYGKLIDSLVERIRREERRFKNLLSAHAETSLNE